MKWTVRPCAAPRRACSIRIILVVCLAALSGVSAAADAPSGANPADLIDIHLSAPGIELGGDLILMPNRNKVELRANMDAGRLEAAGLTIEPGSAMFSWKSEAGVLMFSTGQTDPRNWWIAPQESRVTEIEATFYAGLKRAQPIDELDGAWRQAVRKTASLSILSPTRPDEFLNGEINGFPIGYYPDPFDPDIFKRNNAEDSRWPSLHPERYLPPEHFYRVTEETIDRRISANISLRMFAMDYPWLSHGFPQYVAIDPQLLRKLEDLLGMLRQDGHALKGFTTIYGFRSPHYNLEAARQAGDYNLKALFSMHQYGRALDLIIDDDGDGVMDDLNRDGFIDVTDAAEFMKYVNELDSHYRATGSPLVGGAGIYERHDFIEREHYGLQSPYVHLDVRGFMGDNANLIRWVDPPTIQILWSKLYPSRSFFPGTGPRRPATPTPGELAPLPILE